MTEDEETKLIKIARNFDSNGDMKDEVFESLLRNKKGYQADKKPFKIIKFVVRFIIFLFALIVLTAIYGFRYGSK